MRIPLFSRCSLLAVLVAGSTVAAEPAMDFHFQPGKVLTFQLESPTDRGEFEFTFSGEGTESQGDVFNVHVGPLNGFDESYGVKDVMTSGKYIFFLKRTNHASEDQTGTIPRVYRAKFNIHAVSADRLLSETRLRISQVKWDSGQIGFDLTATPAPDYTVDLTIEKDRALGGNVTLRSGRVPPEQITTQANADGSIHYTVDLKPLGLHFDRRPHIARITVGLDLAAIFVDEKLMNPHDETRLQKEIAAKKSIKKKLR